jgi:hypothetical protein
VGPPPNFAVGDRVRNRIYGVGIVRGAYSSEVVVLFDHGRFDHGSHDKGVIRRIAAEFLELLVGEPVS